MTFPHVWKLGDNVDTDMIIPGRFLANWNSQHEKLKHCCLIDVLPDFSQNVAKGDILVAGRNFGCGSSREAAPMSIKMAGISVILAESFARIFYRNCLNIGLMAITLPNATRDISSGDHIEVMLEQGIVKNLSTGRELPFSPFPEQVLELIRLGSLQAYVLQRIRNKKTSS